MSDYFDISSGFKNFQVAGLINELLMKIIIRCKM